MKAQDQNKRSRTNIIQEKSFVFALRIITLSRTLQRDSRGLVLVRQVLRSGTSIGANIEEVIASQSKKDFSKMHHLIRECRELIAILSRITLTTRRDLMAKQSRPLLPSNNSSFHIPRSECDRGGTS
jgi:four helix bundle protein